MTHFDPIDAASIIKMSSISIGFSRLGDNAAINRLWA